MVVLSQLILLAFGAFLIGVSVWSTFYPRRALTALSKMASTSLINYTELIIRLIVGLAFIGGKTQFALPDWAMVFGVFLVVSAIALMAIPRRWHAAYAIYWSQKIPPIMVVLLMPLSFSAGVFLIRALLV